MTLTQGVPQGSVLGPILYTLFMSPLENLCRSHGVWYHGYTNDTQNYHTFSPSLPGDEDSCIKTLECCINDIRIWMRTNILKLNDDKTEFLIIGTLQQLAKVTTTSIKNGQDNIQKFEAARNLGFYYDVHIKNTIHANKLCSILYLSLKKIAKIRHKFNMDTIRILVQALVTSKLDYCNSLMLGTAEYNLAKLQRIQNSAAHIVYKKRYVLHIAPYLKSLQWLRIKDWITYKIVVLMFKYIDRPAQGYLQDLVIRNHTRTLRSSSQSKLPVIKCNLAQVHKSSLASMGPRIWNSLPYQLRTIDSINDFKGKLKHIYSQSPTISSLVNY